LTLDPQPSTLNPQPSTLNPQKLKPNPKVLSAEHEELVELFDKQSIDLAALAKWRAEHEIKWDKLCRAHADLQAKHP